MSIIRLIIQNVIKLYIIDTNTKGILIYEGYKIYAMEKT